MLAQVIRRDPSPFHGITIPQRTGASTLGSQTRVDFQWQKPVVLWVGRGPEGTLSASNVPHLDWGVLACVKQSSYTLKMCALYDIVYFILQ